MKYKILDVINIASNQTADKFGVIGKEATAAVDILPGRSAVLSLDEGHLTTSVVQSVSEYGDGNVHVKTMNTVYVLLPIESEAEQCRK